MCGFPDVIEAKPIVARKKRSTDEAAPVPEAGEAAPGQKFTNIQVKLETAAMLHKLKRLRNVKGTHRMISELLDEQLEADILFEMEKQLEEARRFREEVSRRTPPPSRQ